MRDFTRARSTNSESRVSNSASDRVLFFAVFGVVLVLFFVMALLTPTILTADKWGIDSFFWKPAYTTGSPDQKYNILVSNKIDFPVTNLLDPRATISVELRNAETSDVVNHVEFRVYDICDFENPTVVEWKRDNVIVRKTVNQKEKEIDFALEQHGE